MQCANGEEITFCIFLRHSYTKHIQTGRKKTPQLRNCNVIILIR